MESIVKAHCDAVQNREKRSGLYLTLHIFKITKENEGERGKKENVKRKYNSYEPESSKSWDYYKKGDSKRLLNSPQTDTSGFWVQLTSMLRESAGNELVGGGFGTCMMSKLWPNLPFEVLTDLDSYSNEKTATCLYTWDIEKLAFQAYITYATRNIQI